MKILHVKRDDDGMRLDRFCSKQLGAPIGLLNKAFRKGLIRLDGKKCEGNTRIAQGQEVQVKLEIGERTHAPRVQKPLDKKAVLAAQEMVLYIDDDVIIVNKPSGLAVQGGSGIINHLVAMLPALQFDSEEAPRLVHRLDKDTSGVMVLARTARVARELQHLLAQHQFQKTYLALVRGTPTPREGEIVSMMHKDADEEGFEKVSSNKSEKGKKAITRYRMRDHLAKTAALMEMQPITGRTHQLRVHAAEAGWPIIGDGKYGFREADSAFGLSQRLHLHAWKLILPPLFGSEEREFIAPLPPHMRESLKKLGLENGGE